MNKANPLIPFAADPWLKSGHAQTLYGALGWKPAVPAPGHALKIAVDAENALLCYHHQARTNNPACLVLLHGLEASADAPYMVSSAHKALSVGLDVLRVNLRGCGNSHHLSRTSYHGGLSGDIEAILRFLHQHFGYRQLMIAGFSLGAHLALKLAGQLAAQAPEYLKGIVAISPPLKLGITSEGLLHPSRRLYERYFFKSMIQTHYQRRRLWPEYASLEPLKKVHNMYDFDEYITAPGFGYKDAQDYYTQNSAIQWLHQIQVPTQIIFAIDDPIIPFAMHQQAMETPHPYVHWLLSAEGGHVGFFNSKLLSLQDRDRLWAENRMIDACLDWIYEIP